MDKNILWSISFTGNEAHLDAPQPSPHALPPQLANQLRKAHSLLNFLDELNRSFKDAAERYMEGDGATDEMKRQAEQIREQFRLVQEWINDMRKQFPFST